jgi:hypothetical protein
MFGRRQWPLLGAAGRQYDADDMSGTGGLEHHVVLEVRLHASRARTGKESRRARAWRIIAHGNAQPPALQCRGVAVVAEHEAGVGAERHREVTVEAVAVAAEGETVRRRAERSTEEVVERGVHLRNVRTVPRREEAHTGGNLGAGWSQELESLDDAGTAT